MNWALAIATALLLIAVQPGPDVAWLAFVALTPLLIAVAREPRAPHRFVLGWAAGIVYWFIHCNWIQFVLEVHGGMGRWGGWGAFILFALYKALHLGVFALFAGWLTGRWWSPVALAALWVGIERTHGTFAFAWLALGNAGIDMGPLLRVAPLIGVYGISFLFALTAAALASMRVRVMAWSVLPLVVFLLPGIAPSSPTTSAVVLQPNLDEEAQWTTESATAMQQRLIARSLQAAEASHAPLIIWPESPGPLYYSTDPQFKAAAEGLALAAHASFLFGTVGYTKDNAPLNSAMMLSPEGRPVDRYDKVNLVPFGEFVPPLFSFVNRITKEAGDFTSGTRVSPLPYGSRRLGTFICYESAFPNFVRQLGGDALVNISNDGYFGRSYARAQHLSLVRMRAVENHRWIVRATNDGVSAVVDPSGRVTERLQPFVETAATVHFGYENGITPYARYGDWFAWICLAASLSCAGLRARRRL